MKTDYPRIIAECNNTLLEAKVQIQKLGIPAFNSANLSTHSFLQACEITVAHRFVNKFSPPGVNLRDITFAGYIQYESVLRSIPQISHLWGEGIDWFRLRQARRILHTMLSDFNQVYDESRVEFTPGETFISSDGDVSVFSKLSNLKHWTVTSDALDDALMLIYTNRGIKAAARIHIKRLFGKMTAKKCETPEETFFRYARKLLTVVGGARGATVPKNIQTDRFINIEPMFNMILQRCISAALRLCLKRSGHDLGNITLVDFEVTGILEKVSRALKRDGQAVNKKLARDLSNVTIDFSNASDSTLIWAVRLMFPVTVYGRLMKTRSRYVRVSKTHWCEPVKLSSMGNGYTFEVMTLLLLACARSLDSGARVYGDDVVIKKEYGADFIRLASTLGYKINHDKTFLDGPFRESCGGFYHNGRAITSYAFSWCESFQDVLITYNKCMHILLTSPPLSSLNPIFLEVIRRLDTLIPLRCRCDVIPSDWSLSFWAYDPASTRKRIKKKSILSEHQKLFGDDPSVACPLTHYPNSRLRIVEIPWYVPKRVRTKRDFAFHELMNLYAMRSSTPNIRGKGRWVNIPVIVLPNGTAVRVSRYHRLLAC